MLQTINGNLYKHYGNDNIKRGYGGAQKPEERNS
jgi:hypothetical protein